MSMDSSIVEEVRRRRHEISEQFDHDLKRYGEHLKKLQDQLGDRVVNRKAMVESAPGTSRPKEKP